MSGYFTEGKTEERVQEMGQAKRRGTKEERIAQAQARVSALRPEKLVCGKCKADIVEFETMETRVLPGLDAAYAGNCPQCGHSTWAFKGTDEAMADAAAIIEEMVGEQLQMGIQTADGKNIEI